MAMVTTPHLSCPIPVAQDSGVVSFQAKKFQEMLVLRTTCMQYDVSAILLLPTLAITMAMAPM